MSGFGDLPDIQIDYTPGDLGPLYTPETRPWRSLLRVVRVYKTRITVFIPAFSRHARDTVGLKIADLPPEIQARLETGYRFHARVNKGALRKEDLKFTDWEP